MATSLSGRLKDLIKKYGKVAVGVHLSVSAASITGLYVAIKNNADVESIFDRLHLPGVGRKSTESPPPTVLSDGPVVLDDGVTSTPEAAVPETEKKRNRTADLAATGGGALALAVLFNKALIPVRIPITIALTPPLARFLARRRIIKDIVR